MPGRGHGHGRFGHGGGFGRSRIGHDRFGNHGFGHNGFGRGAFGRGGGGGGGGGGAVYSSPRYALPPPVPELKAEIHGYPTGVFFVSAIGEDADCGCPGEVETIHVDTTQYRLPLGMSELYTQEEWTRFVSRVDEALQENHVPCFPLCFANVFICIPAMVMCYYQSQRVRAVKDVLMTENVRLHTQGLEWVYTDRLSNNHHAFLILKYNWRRKQYEADHAGARKVTEEPLPPQFRVPLMPVDMPPLPPVVAELPNNNHGNHGDVARIVPFPGSPPGAAFPMVQAYPQLEGAEPEGRPNFIRASEVEIEVEGAPGGPASVPIALPVSIAPVAASASPSYVPGFHQALPSYGFQQPPQPNYGRNAYLVANAAVAAPVAQSMDAGMESDSYGSPVNLIPMQNAVINLAPPAVVAPKVVRICKSCKQPGNENPDARFCSFCAGELEWKQISETIPILQPAL